MKKLRNYLASSALVGLTLLAAGCNVSTANLSSLKVSTDKEGKAEATAFKGGETIYGRAQVSNNPGKVVVKFYMVADNVAGLSKGETLKGSEIALDIDGDKFASYNVTASEGMPKGTYTLIADMMNDAGEKKDSKSAAIKVGEE